MARKFRSWKTLLSEEVFSTPWMSIFHNQFEMTGGRRGNYFYLHTNGSALIVPVASDGKIILVRQYRYLTNSVSLELPCGGIKDGQDDEAAARAELVEETGFDCQKLKRAGRFLPYNGLSDEFCTVFVAWGLSEVGQRPDVTEEIEVVSLSPDEIDKLVERGKITDGMTIAGWKLAQKHL
ncbi:MAG: NUDIX hydrolase [Spirochaetes bacterium]|nr:NUDIX hydrolase [Spirochaetota bacterium]